MVNPLFKLIKDKHEIYDSSTKKKQVVVKDDASYVESRKLIEEIKESSNPQLVEIIVQNRHYFEFYSDLEELGDLAIVKTINPVEVFETKFDYQRPDYASADFLIENRLLTEAEGFNRNYNPEFDFKTNLLLYQLELETLHVVASLTGVLEFLQNQPLKLELLSQSELLFEVFNERVLAELAVEEFFITDIKAAIKENNLTEYLNFLLSCYIFSHYHKRSYYNRFISKLDYEVTSKLEGYYSLSNQKKLAPLCRQLYYKRQSVVRQLNNQLQVLEDELEIFTEELDYEVYLTNISGYLEHELDYLLANLLQELKTQEVTDYHLALLAEIERKFTPLLEKENLAAEFRQFKKLIQLLAQIQQKESLPTTFTGWTEFYIDDYLTWDNNLEEEKNIFNIINSLEEKYDITLQQIQNQVQEKLVTINQQYEKFLWQNYGNLLSSQQNIGVFSRLREIKQILNQDQPVILIVIDAMRWDMWEIINSIFEKHGFTSSQDRQASLSLVPSVTSVSRRALFAGMRYDSLQEKKLSGQFRHSISNESEHLESYFAQDRVVFAKGGKNDFKELVQQEADLYTFIFTAADDMFHGLKDINRELIEALFKNQVQNIIETIDRYDYLAQAKIAVATDHGSVKINDKKYKNIDKGLRDYIKEQGLEYKAHGRYLKIYGDNFKLDKYQQIRDYLETKEEDYWHIINREEMSDFYLPQIETSGENYFWLICKYNYYSQGTHGEYAHGGLSMSETIIPFAVLQQEEINFKELDLKLVDSELVTEQESYLELVLFNNNSYPLRDVELNLEEFGIRDRIELIDSNDRFKIRLNLLPQSSGLIQEQVRVMFDFAGTRKEYITEISLEVEESSKTRIDKSLQESRELF